MKLLRSVLPTAFALLLAPSAWAIPTAVQDFEGGTTQGWIAGGGPIGAAPPVLPALATGGPAGPADHYLRIVSTGSPGSGGQLMAINREAWDGDYLASGLTNVTADLRNFGPSDLYIRLLVIDAANNRFASTGAVFLSAGGDWTAGVFSLSPGNLLVGLGAVNDLLGSVTELRIWGTGDSNAVFEPGVNLQNAVVGTLGLDNLTPNVFGNGGGGVMPEPATAWLAILGLLGAAGAARWRGATRPPPAAGRGLSAGPTTDRQRQMTAAVRAPYFGCRVGVEDRQLTSRSD